MKNSWLGIFLPSLEDAIQVVFGVVLGEFILEKFYGVKYKDI